ncbi:MAG: hypothetical protein ACRDRL_24505 [Sciscionella sp.]
MSGSTPDETFRASLRVRNPNREFATLIVTRQGREVWLTRDAAHGGDGQGGDRRADRLPAAGERR